MQYRCQSNFIIILSPSISAPRAIEMEGKFVLALRCFFTNIMQSNSAFASDDPLRFIPKIDLNRLTIPDDDTLVRQHIYSKNNNFDFNHWNSNTGHYSENGLAFLSALFDETDLKSKQDGVDAEGKSWDNEDYPFQNITTITIHTGANYDTSILNYFGQWIK